ncbi:hypothetical protein M434DRAFT_401585 [Hypoxylon sp. CO27-5]|nr:hypothetical protein M434DRAFT_401585 [Hypoxylon sp. CO27-5]
MAKLLSVSRPLLLSSFRSRAPSPILINLRRSFSITTLRPYGSRGRGSRQSRTSQSKPFKKDEVLQMQANMTLLLPNTFVAPPLWRYPRQPSKFAHMLWLNVKARAQSLWAIMSMKMLSQPTMIFSKPLFKFHKSAVIPTAKALHVQMSEAIAAGDKETLRSICTPELFQTLAATIDSRPRGVRAEWELVRYDQRWRFPRIADWRVGYQPLHDGSMKMVKQAVVSIASIQRIARYDDSKGGIKIAGSQRVRPMIEHLVIQAVVDKTTYESAPWKIWGTLSEMTYEEYLADVENLQAIMSDQVGKT